MFQRIVMTLIMLPSWIVTWLLEALLTRRGLAIIYFALAGLFVIGPWLRPILSFDLRATHIPMSIWSAPQITPTELLVSPRQFRFDSAGAVLLAIIAWGCIAVLFRPRSLPFWAGTLMCCGIAATAEVTLNHPALIDLMDSEVTQRTQLASVLREVSEQSLAANSPPRTTRLRIPKLDNSPEREELEPGDMMRGWFYGMYGPWFIFVSAFVVLVHTRGGWDRRLAHLGVWSLVGCGLAGLICSRRLVAEYHWDRAQELERIGALVEAEQEIDKAKEIFPEFNHLDRTWWLVGKIDYRRNRVTSEEMYFRITQLAEHSERAAALSLTEDLLAQQRAVPFAVRNLASSIFSDIGKKRLNQGLYVAAQDLYRRAYDLAPHRVDCPVALGTIWMHTDRYNPERIQAFYDRLAARVGDRLLRADLMERIGDAFFEADQHGDHLVSARKYYEQSIATFAQPKFPNPPAQEGMLGM